MWITRFIIAILLIFPLFAKAQQYDDVQLANEYFSRGELEKARVLYEEIAKDDEKVMLIHSNYFYLLLTTQDYKTAEKYIEKLVKRNPSHVQFALDQGMLMRAQGKDGSADKHFKDIITSISANTYLVRNAANYFLNNQMSEYALLTFTESRQKLNNPYIYSLELASLHRLNGQKDSMVEEYLNYILSNPSNIRYVKNSLQNLLEEPEEYEKLETVLYDKLQKDPSNEIYPDLLIWVNLQLKNFQSAFIQARALDRRMDTGGEQSMEIGQIALRNGDYTTSAQIFKWVTENYPQSPNYFRARMYLIQSYELKIKNTYPIEKEEIRSIIADYNQLISELGNDRNSQEAMRNKALLHAFYLDEKDSAVNQLQKLLSMPRGNPVIRAQSKLDLGDIYLLMDQPWESTLLYSQVEKEMSETPIGYEAKLKNARLSYYKGDFLLAQEHLDILKEATTREISNDAMSLSLLIKDNIALDSSETAMRRYSAIELLLYQNKNDEALRAMNLLREDYPNHTLTDELLWQESNMLLREGNFEKALTLLDEINQYWFDDILGDDALFLTAEIYERHIGQKEKAQEIYLAFLSKYPGSVFAAEARKRFRALRGDFKDQVIN